MFRGGRNEEYRHFSNRSHGLRSSAGRAAGLCRRHTAALDQVTQMCTAPELDQSALGVGSNPTATPQFHGDDKPGVS